MRYHKSNVECYNCHKCGHYSQKFFNITNHVEEKANIVDDKVELDDPTLLLAFKNMENNDASLQFLDNGVSNT